MSQVSSGKCSNAPASSGQYCGIVLYGIKLRSSRSMASVSFSSVRYQPVSELGNPRHAYLLVKHGVFEYQDSFLRRNWRVITRLLSTLRS